uniref:Secreted protein n=1 Tax=Strongyloides papillosus TaxID=174720 RepID=A0A0N5BMC0_STREA
MKFNYKLLFFEVVMLELLDSILFVLMPDTELLFDLELLLLLSVLESDTVLDFEAHELEFNTAAFFFLCLIKEITYITLRITIKSTRIAPQAMGIKTIELILCFILSLS